MDTNGRINLCEDYVSFEIAKLLKEKGFDENCMRSYVKDKLAISQGFNNSYYETMYSDRCYRPISAPTLQMAMKWLREVHNLVIEPYRTARGYLYTISNIPYGSIKYDNSEACNGDDEGSGQWTTWEKACEDAIEYCLVNLI